MTYDEASKLVQQSKNHAEIHIQMGKCFENLNDVLTISQKEFENFYVEFVEMVVGNNPSLLEN